MTPSQILALEAKIALSNTLHDKLGNCHPKLARGQVWCVKCGATQKVNSGQAMRNGWPLCCGETMTIDSPDERST